MPISKTAWSLSGSSLIGASIAAATWAALPGSFGSLRSKSVTRWPESVRRQPSNRPIRPAPTMAMFMSVSPYQP